MNPSRIKAKFGDNYLADEDTFMMGIDLRFTRHFAERFEHRVVLETCTGAGFTTISLARQAARVITVDIDPDHLEQAQNNVSRAGVEEKVSFLNGDILNPELVQGLPQVDAAFLDPDWAVGGPNHVFRFRDSNTQPPADHLLEMVLNLTPNLALVLPPLIPTIELSGLPPHERESLYLGESHELYCLYFGELIRTPGQSEFRTHPLP